MKNVGEKLKNTVDKVSMPWPANVIRTTSAVKADVSSYVEMEIYLSAIQTICNADAEDRINL